MNEQNNINPNAQPIGGQAPVQPVTPQVAVQPQQQAAVAPTPVAPVQNPQPVQAAQPVAQPVQQPVQQPQIQSDATQQPIAQPQAVAPVQSPTPVEATPQVATQQAPEQPNVGVQQPSTVPNIATNNSQQPVSQPNVVQQPAPVAQPTPPEAPAAPVANTSSVPNNGVFGPSVPLTGVNNATDIGFVAASTELPKKKKKGPIIVIILVILIALAALGYFVVYPFIMKTYFSNPKNVYETSIKNVVKGISTTTNDLVHNKAIYDIEASFDTNIEELKDYTGYSYNINFGVDPVKKTIQEGIAIKNLSSNVEHSYYYYIKDDKAYEKYSSYRGYIYKGLVDPEQTKDIFSLFNSEELFDNANKLNSEDINYITDKFSQLLVDSIDESKLSKEDTSITIDGKTIKVTNNKYEIDFETLTNTINTIIDGILNDDKAIEIIAKSSEVTKDELKKALEEIKITDENNKDEEIVDRSETITTSIYTYGTKNEIVGFGLSNSEEDVDFHYYFNDSYYEAILKTKVENEDTGKIEESVIEVVGKKNGDNTKVSVKYNDKEVATLDIKQWDEKGIEFDYSLIADEDTITGSIKFVKDINNERAKFSFDASLKMGKEHISVSLAVTEDWTSEVANINTDSAVQLSDEEMKKQQEDFMNALKDTPVGKLITTISGDYDPTIKDYYDNNDDYDYGKLIEPSDPNSEPVV